MSPDYEYETSPKKIERYENKTKKTQKKTKQVYRSKKTKQIKIAKVKTILFLLVVFVIVFIIGYRNTLITEAYSKTETLKNQYSAIEKENEQIQVSIDNCLNLNNIEQSAKELLGMTKLTSKQTVYITVPKEDYIETQTDEEQEDKSFIKKIIDKIF